MTANDACIMPQIYTADAIEKAIAAAGSTFEQQLIQAVEHELMRDFSTEPTLSANVPMRLGCVSPVSSDDDGSNDSLVVIKMAAMKDPPLDQPEPKHAASWQLLSSQSSSPIPTPPRLVSLLLDEAGLLPQHRAAAVGAVAAKHLLPPVVEKIGILGTGRQIRHQLRYLQHVTECRHVLICGRTEKKVEAMYFELRKEGYKVQATMDANFLLSECDLIVTCTTATESVLSHGAAGAPKQKEGVPPKPQLVLCMGAIRPGSMEVDPTLVAASDRLVSEGSPFSCKQVGEFQHALSQGLVDMGRVEELSTILRSGGVVTEKPQQDTDDEHEEKEEKENVVDDQADAPPPEAPQEAPVDEPAVVVKEEQEDQEETTHTDPSTCESPDSSSSEETPPTAEPPAETDPVESAVVAPDNDAPEIAEEAACRVETPKKKKVKEEKPKKEEKKKKKKPKKDEEAQVVLEEDKQDDHSSSSKDDKPKKKKSKKKDQEPSEEAPAEEDDKVKKKEKKRKEKKPRESKEPEEAKDEKPQETNEGKMGDEAQTVSGDSEDAEAVQDTEEKQSTPAAASTRPLSGRTIFASTGGTAQDYAVAVAVQKLLLQVRDESPEGK